jgi:hypothetical protein
MLPAASEVASANPEAMLATEHASANEATPERRSLGLMTSRHKSGVAEEPAEEPAEEDEDGVDEAA